MVQTSLADLKEHDEAAEKSYRKIKLVVEEIEGNACYTNFHGMDVTRDKLCSLLRKWQTTIEAYIDIKTTDDYMLRLFVICFTARMQRQLRATSYATAAKIKAIRHRIVEIVMRQAQQHSLKTLLPVLYFLPSSCRLDEKIEEEIRKGCFKFYPIQNVLIRKVKVLKKPRFDTARFQEFYGDRSLITSDILAQTAPQAEEPQNLFAEAKKE